MPCGVMVALRILVPSVRVRVLPRQQRANHPYGGLLFFLCTRPKSGAPGHSGKKFYRTAIVLNFKMLICGELDNTGFSVAELLFFLLLSDKS